MAKTRVGQSAAPGTPDPAGKKPEKKSGKRVEYPLVGNKDEKVYPFAVLPPDFDFDGHKPLRKRDFTTDELYFRYKAAEMGHKMEAFTARAEEAAKLGSVKDRAKARRLQRMQSKMSELREELEAQGVDVDALLAD